MSVAAASPVQIAAFYVFAPVADVPATCTELRAMAGPLGIRGTILVAPEGVNGTIAGSGEAVAAVLDHIRALPGCAALDVKYSRSAELPFLRLKVRPKREIVTMGVAGLDMARRGDYVPPADWNELIAAPDVAVIDTRNDFEVGLGSFAGAINPGTERFGEFPAWFDAEAERLRTAGKTRIAMFCTGGIRCEKATAYVKAQGFDAVYHLQGGILRYLEAITPADSRFEGECFVFDQRVSVGHGLAETATIACPACRMPVSEAERASPLYVAGESCPHCHGRREAEALARTRARKRQLELAARRGDRHLGR